MYGGQKNCGTKKTSGEEDRSQAFYASMIRSQSLNKPTPRL